MATKHNTQRYLIASFVISLFLTSCSLSGPGKVRENPNEEKTISFFTKKETGTSWDDIMASKNDGGIGMPVNALLWRAALDIASFVPLNDVDTFGGSIVTEWYVPENQPNRRLKLAVFVVGLELRSDAIQVRAYVQTRDGDDWTNAGRDSALGRKLEDLILTRARELRAVAGSVTSN